MTKITLDSLALAAARQTSREIDALDDAHGDAEPGHFDPLADALHTYFVTAQVRGLVHDLPVIPGGVSGYEHLARILGLAYDQSAKGKGKERHANARPFEKQPIMEIARMCGLGYQTGQIQKKVQEATTMASRGNTAGAKAELLGAIVYAAAAYLTVEESESK